MNIEKRGAIFPMWVYDETVEEWQARIARTEEAE